MEDFRSEVQGMCALHSKLARMDGCKLDKKAARYSAMADYCLQAGALSKPFSRKVALSLISEAVETAIIGSPLHIPGEPYNRQAYKWMEAQEDE